MAQLVNLIDAHLVDHLAPVLGDDVKQVVDDLGIAGNAP